MGEQRHGSRTRWSRSGPWAVLAAVLAPLLAASVACSGPAPDAPPIAVSPALSASPAPDGDAPAVLPLAPAGSAGGLQAPLPASGSRTGPKICGKFQSVPVAGGRYEVQNNAWGDDTPQCTQAFDTGFAVQASHAKDSGPAAYPSIVFGCNYGTCTRGTPFPRPIADLGDVRSSWAVTTPSSGTTTSPTTSGSTRRRVATAPTPAPSS